MAWAGSRRTFLAGCTISLVAALTGCGGGGGGGGGSASTTVTGTVYDSAKGDTQLEGATVTIGSVSGTTVTTSQAAASSGVLKVGTFQLTNVPKDINTLTVTFTNTRTTDDSGTTETFTDTQTLRFQPAIASGANNIGDLYVNIGQIGGQVLLPNGQPADGAFVSISATGDLVQTDTTGKFFVANIPKGSTDISAVIGTASGTRTVTITNGINDIGTLQLTEDPNPNPPGFPATIVGKITTSDGQTAAASPVILLRDGVQIEQTTADTSGNYSFYVPTGNYSVRVLRDGYLEGNASGAVTNPNTAIRLDVTISPRV